MPVVTGGVCCEEREWHGMGGKSPTEIPTGHCVMKERQKEIEIERKRESYLE